MKSIGYFVSLFAVILLSSCSSHIPTVIKQELEAAPELGQVRADSNRFISDKVRWGGVIVNIENKDSISRLTIVAFPLSSDGEPNSSAQSSGRFIAVVDTFLEPTVYTTDRAVTIIGNLLKSETSNIGEFPYVYPVVQAEHYYLWPVKQEPGYYDYPPPYWYDPWYPYYPFYSPYYSHPYHR